LEEFLIVSHNFQCPVEVVVEGRHISGLVEQLDEENVLIAGQWYLIEEVHYASPI